MNKNIKPVTSSPVYLCSHTCTRQRPLGLLVQKRAYLEKYWFIIMFAKYFVIQNTISIKFSLNYATWNAESMFRVSFVFLVPGLLQFMTQRPVIHLESTWPYSLPFLVTLFCTLPHSDLHDKHKQTFSDVKQEANKRMIMLVYGLCVIFMWFNVFSYALRMFTIYMLSSCND